MITFKMTGEKNLLKRFKGLEEKVERRIGKAGVRAGGNKLARIIRKDLPVSNDGNDIVLKKSIGVAGVKGRRNANKIMVQVGVKGPARRYAHLVEFGRQGTSYPARRIFTDAATNNTGQVFEAVKARLQSEFAKL